jgi:hypothetical protein
VNDQSLERVNAFLAAVAGRTETGGILDVTPAEIGRELGFPDALSTARAVRALVARRRLEAAEGSYRLLDPTPVGADEKEALGRRPRKRRAPAGARRASESADRSAIGYSDLGRATVDKLIELGREVSQLRASNRTTREENRELRESKDEAERRARSLAERVRELEGRAEMAEANLRTLLASARSREGSRGDAAVGDSEMEAILGVLRGEGAEAAATGAGADPSGEDAPPTPLAETVAAPLEPGS